MYNEELEKISIGLDDISDEGIDFENMSDDELEKDSKTQENFDEVNADDSVKLYLQQIGKIPLLTKDEELKVAKQIKENNN